LFNFHTFAHHELKICTHTALLRMRQEGMIGASIVATMIDNSTTYQNETVFPELLVSQLPSCALPRRHDNRSALFERPQAHSQLARRYRRTNHKLRQCRGRAARSSDGVLFGLGSARWRCAWVATASCFRSIKDSSRRIWTCLPSSICPLPR
jgi:hypothetical protein